jgi:hypothetical protein
MIACECGLNPVPRRSSESALNQRVYEYSLRDAPGFILAILLTLHYLTA